MPGKVWEVKLLLEKDRRSIIVIRGILVAVFVGKKEALVGFGLVGDRVHRIKPGPFGRAPVAIEENTRTVRTGAVGYPYRVAVVAGVANDTLRTGPIRVYRVNIERQIIIFILVLKTIFELSGGIGHWALNSVNRST